MGKYPKNVILKERSDWRILDVFIYKQVKILRCNQNDSQIFVFTQSLQLLILSIMQAVWYKLLLNNKASKPNKPYSIIPNLAFA